MEINFDTKPNYSGPTTTQNSKNDGRLKVDAGQKLLKKFKKKKKNMKKENKGKTKNYDQSDIMGEKPYGSIGKANLKLLKKLKKKKVDSLRAKGSTSKSGEIANVGAISKSIGNFVKK